MVKTDSRIIVGALVIVFVLALGYSTVSNYLVEYKTVSEAMRENSTDMIWVNGTILKNSFTPLNTGEYVFTMTDGASNMSVSFTGQLPSSLNMDADILVLGKFSGGTFQSVRMITKCPTKYR